MRKKTEKVINEDHLYTDKIEAGTKTLVWVILWAGGILPLLGTQNKTMLAGTYFLFSLSLLTEFVLKIKTKISFWNKIRHSIFCFLIAMICVMSIMILFGIQVSNRYYLLLFWLTLGIIIYMIIDTFLLWIEND